MRCAYGTIICTYMPRIPHSTKITNDRRAPILTATATGPYFRLPTLTIIFSPLLSLSLCYVRVSASLHARTHPKSQSRPRLDLEAVVVDAREPSSHCSVPGISVTPLREYRGVAFERAMF